MRAGRGFAGSVASGAMLLGAFAAPAGAEPAAAISPGNTLVLFDTAAPTVVTTRAITGLGPAETVRGIDVRPSTGQVYVSTVTTGIASNSFIRTYTLDTSTGAATFVGVTQAAVAQAGDVPSGYDFNPLADRIRYVNTNDENARLNPVDGTLAVNDTNLTPPATTTIIAAAYDRNRPETGATTLYDIDRNDSQVAIQGGINGTPSPNNGIVTDLAPLGFNLNQANDGGFDVSVSGTAHAALTDAADNLTRLYRIALPAAVTAPPVATAIGLIGNGQTEIRSLTILDDDRDADGTATSADNCPSLANADQANLDGDAQGDACDDDDDNDGLSDAAEASLGTNPLSTDSDADGKRDASDLCPIVAAPATASGCPDAAPSTPAQVLPPAPTFTVTGLPRRVALRTLRTRGVSFTLQPNQPVSFLVELRGRARGSRIARAGDIVLGERRLSLSASRRRVRVVIPRSQRGRLRRGARLSLSVRATDAAGRTRVATRRLTIR